ncbi:MAG TPA: tetratricopeptide repeat protein [Blastocatellia bacterium]|nr:tetratricopeptide repeat protein [Blastocatellia bacterium]
MSLQDVSIKLFALCIFLFAYVSAVGAQQVAPAQASIEKAQTLLSAGKADEAIAALTAIQKSESNATLINHLMGLAYYQKGDYTHAIEHLSIAVQKAPQGSSQYRQAVQLLGLSHYLLGHVKEAIPYLEQVKNWSPDNVEMAYTLGLCYIQTRDADKSREAFARMFSVPPTSASAYLINAQMMIRQQFEEFAEKELQKALEIDPRLPQANYLMGELAVYRADIDRGIALLEKEIAINPGFAMAYYMLGEALTRKLRWDEAIAPLQKSIWLNPFFSGPYIVLGKVYLKKGDFANAESILRRALRMDPNNYSGHHLLAQVLQQTNRPDEAKKEFELADKFRTISDK